MNPNSMPFCVQEAGPTSEQVMVPRPLHKYQLDSVVCNDKKCTTLLCGHFSSSVK